MTPVEILQELIDECREDERSLTGAELANVRAKRVLYERSLNRATGVPNKPIEEDFDTFVEAFLLSPKGKTLIEDIVEKVTPNT